ncbi:hypothetical protein PABG_03766 [Paracoccidioides brasiliensis Pb03]|uniref:MGS207 protein n=1 Tax=Paracoccidioides brasiliensis TaxID=121759 RepID=A0A1D2JEL5_PARBR|nr:hypothetical protein PABG_03766 [Paracoccidioides brasiliensis Pb03]ODH28206.1 hypothetical protein ACO22_03976 [Paracoccidioides brasiliensis]
MFSQFSFSMPSIRGLFSSVTADSDSINLDPVEIHDIETNQQKSARALKHLLKLNHANFSILYHDDRFHNHMPHLLSSVYLFGGDAEHLNRLYEAEAMELEPWRDSPGEISADDWRDFLGKTQYQRAFVDFFEDELVRHGYDWKKIAEKYLYSGKKPLINCLVSGLGHPLIHLGYAYEMSSRDVAMESLSMAATCYNDLHKYLDDPSYLQIPATYQTSSPLEILRRIRTDKRFDNLFQHPGGDNLETLFKHNEEAVLEHWRAWSITPNPTEQLEISQQAAAAIFVASDTEMHDFFLVHLLTTSHAVRILLPFVPPKYHLSLVRQWWLIVVAIYIAQLRPKIDTNAIKNYEIKGRNWDWVGDQCINGKWAENTHYIKALRALKEAARTWGDHDEYFIKAGVKLVDEFKGFEGFSE